MDILTRPSTWIFDRRDGQRGSMILEALIAVAILGTISGIISVSLFQAASFRRVWADDAIATKDLRHAQSWLASDALNAETVNLADGGAATSTVTITWTDSDSVSHSATYQVDGDRLVRDEDGAVITVARSVVYAGFSLLDQVLAAEIEIRAADGATESATLDTYLRALQ